MKILRGIKALRQWRAACDGTVGFVPTMGALHAGHLALIEASVAENSVTLVSLFVNPTQFNDAADCADYPSPLEADLAACEAAGVEAVFLPEAAELYPDDYRYRVVETERSRELEGAMRPGHFEGVLTVVMKLLLLAEAERAYFGEKDWQQLELVRGMAEAFFVRTRIVGLPTVREADGLALSSRNVRLSEAGRRRAALFPRILREAADAATARVELEAAGFAVEYVVDRARDRRRLGAVVLEGTRLIDNLPLEECGKREEPA